MTQEPLIPFRVVAWRILAILMAASAAMVIALYPIARAPLLLAFLGYILVLWHKPNAWLLVLPALLPVLDLTPWSGWFFLEEIDLFVLGTLAVGYWRLPNQPVHHKFSPIGTMLLALLSGSYVIAAINGLMPLSPLDANAFSSYFSHYNSLRILKGFVWALLLIPILLRVPDQKSETLPRWLTLGMLLGLTGTTMVAWWERWTFPGLTDFASDYRITAMFSGMHVGGAALDGYLALSLPFLLAWIVFQSTWWRVLIGGILFFAASYAVMVTFSRGLYLAYGLTVPLALGAVFRSGSARPRSLQEGLIVTGLLLCLGVLLWRVFGSGGYRALAALVVLFGATGLIAPLLHRGTVWLVVAPVVAIMCMLTFVLDSMVSKGPYIAFTLSVLFAIIAGVLVLATTSSVRRAGRMLAATALLWMGANAVNIAWHWGGAVAARDASLAVAICLAVLVVSLRASTTWTLSKHNLLRIGIGLLTIAVVVPVLSSYRMENRFGEVSEDFSTRLAHWTQSLSIMDQQQWIFGAGLGRFAETYYWKNRLAESPGTYSLSRDNNNSFIMLSGARYEKGYGESLRIGQRVGFARPGQYLVSLDAHVTGNKVRMEFQLCEKWLLYHMHCGVKEITVNAQDSAWQKIAFLIDGKRFSSAPWYMRPTLQFSIANVTASSIAELTNVSLTNSGGRELLNNGNFAQGMDHWFFSSDHYHLPWHTKNLWLNVFFEQGVFGLTAFTLMLAYAFLQKARDSSITGVQRIALVASLGGFLVVGLFDSELDVPRLAWLFYLLLFVSMLKSLPENVRKHLPT